MKGTGPDTAAVTVEVPANVSLVQQTVNVLVASVALSIPSPKATTAAKAARAKRATGLSKESKKAAKAAEKSTDSKSEEAGEGDKEDEDKSLDYEFGDNALNFEF